MFFKEFLPLIRQSVLSIMKNILVPEINTNEKSLFIWLYRLSNQSYEDLKGCSSNLSLSLSNTKDEHPVCSILSCIILYHTFEMIR